MYRVIIYKKAAKFLKSHSVKEQKLIYSKLDLLKENPKNNPILDLKKMTGFEDLFRLRISRIRIIYQVIDNERLVLVISVGTRGGVYKKK